MTTRFVGMPQTLVRLPPVHGRTPASLSSLSGLIALVHLALLGGASPAVAQADERVHANPPVIDMWQPPAARKTRVALPPDAMRARGDRTLELTIGYTDSRIYNPVAGRKDRVRLRSYSGPATDPDRPYVAPTIEAMPGDTVRITLRNRLPSDPTCTGEHTDPNIPQCFNATNLHSHGLWISPAGNSDNVLLSIDPGVDFQYEYNLPPDHPAGTFWYHPHRHGSTALQVASGMAGALIVRGDRLPTADANGDLDTLLRTGDGRPMPERVLVLQQIQYACLDAEGNIKVQRDEAGNVVAWVCDPDDTGVIEFYEDPAGTAQFGPGTWAQSGRYTSINGLVLPSFLSTAGDIERWRLIHAGVRDTISLEFRRLKPDAAMPDTLSSADAKRFIDDNCTGDPIPYYLVAADGLTLSAARRVTGTTLQPGYRNDALVVFPEAGMYCVINASVPAAASVSRTAPSRRLLGVVVAAPGTAVTDIDQHVRDRLIKAARRSMPRDIRRQVIADLQDGFKLSKFVPFDDIADDEVTGNQELTFSIDLTVEPARFEVNGEPYKPGRIDRMLPVGGVDEWSLHSELASHPFHIHVNPFQIVRILDPNGRDVSAPGAVDDSGGAVDPQYPGLKGVWKDTLWIKSLIPQVEPPGGVYTIVLRTRYERYIGDFVLHCHILDHEDRGMMQNVRIFLPDAEGMPAHAH